MVEICDNCGCNLKDDKHIVELNGGNKCLCTDCWYVLSAWCGSGEHITATDKYKKQFMENN